jgi:hypothetical protein
VILNQLLLWSGGDNDFLTASVEVPTIPRPTADPSVNLLLQNTTTRRSSMAIVGVSYGHTATITCSMWSRHTLGYSTASANRVAIASLALAAGTQRNTDVIDRTTHWSLPAIGWTISAPADPNPIWGVYSLLVPQPFDRAAWAGPGMVEIATSWPSYLVDAVQPFYFNAPIVWAQLFRGARDVATITDALAQLNPGVLQAGALYRGDVAHLSLIDAQYPDAFIPPNQGGLINSPSGNDVAVYSVEALVALRRASGVINEQFTPASFAWVPIGACVTVAPGWIGKDATAVSLGTTSASWQQTMMPVWGSPSWGTAGVIPRHALGLGVRAYRHAGAQTASLQVQLGLQVAPSR